MHKNFNTVIHGVLDGKFKFCSFNNILPAWTSMKTARNFILFQHYEQNCFLFLKKKWNFCYMLQPNGLLSINGISLRINFMFPDSMQ